MSDLAPKSRAALGELLDLVREAGDRHFTAERGVIEEGTAAEGYRFLTHLLAAGCEHHLEGDAAHPLFTRIVSPLRKVLGDNPDALYFWSPIDARYEYVISGNLGGSVYTSFTVHGNDPDGGAMAKVLADVNDRDIDVDSMGNYRLTLAAGAGGRGHIELDGDAAMIVTRHYFEHPTSACADPALDVRLAIERTGAVEPRPPWTDESVAAGLQRVRRFVRANTLGMPAPGEAPPYPFVSRTPNALPKPASFRASDTDTMGAVDIHYAMAPYLLQPGQRLVMEGTLPPCAFANVVLWNMHMQTFEYRSRRTSLNRAQMKLDGNDFRIVVADADPGEPNWLDTDGHMLGTVFWRILLPEEEPGEIRCSVEG